MTEERRFTLSMRREQFDELLGTLGVGSDPLESAALLACGVSESDEETRFLARRIIAIPDEDVLYRNEIRMSIRYAPLLGAMKTAAAAGEKLFFVHTHPQGAPDFSEQDDREEAELSRVAHDYSSTLEPLGSIVVSAPDRIRARVWLRPGRHVRVSRVRLIGRRLEFPVFEDYTPDYELFDRQVRAFGHETQKILAGLHVGVVGCGGTGSAAAEQLARLGVGTISLVDSQTVEASNVTRIHESVASDSGSLKVDVLEVRLQAIRPEIEIKKYSNKIMHKDVARAMRDCDVLFGCTDDNLGRYVLNQLSTKYLIPVFDTAVKIDSEAGGIRAVVGRITRLMAGEACLLCRGRLNVERMRAEALPETELRELEQQGYAPELDQPDPAVVPFTTVVAGLAASLLIDYLTSFRGLDANTNEVLVRFDDLQFVRSLRLATDDCWCGALDLYGRGDQEPFLDMVWPPDA